VALFLVSMLSCVTNPAQTTAVVRWARYSALQQGVDQARS
jgi:hypothetical protein